jgi:hypothetical protein
MKYDYTKGTVRIFKQDNSEINVIAAEDRFRHGRITITEFENGDIEVRDELGNILFPDLITITTPGEGEEILADIGVEHPFDFGTQVEIEDWINRYPNCVMIKTPSIGIPQNSTSKSVLRHKPVYDASRNSIWLLYSNLLNLSHLIRIDLTTESIYRYNIRLTTPDAIIEPSRLLVVNGHIIIGYDQSVSDADGMINGQYGWIEEFNPNGGIFTLLWSGSLGSNSGGWGDPMFVASSPGSLYGKVVWPINGVVGSRCIVGNVPLTADSNEWGESRLTETPTSNMNFYHSEQLNTETVRAAIIGAVNSNKEADNVMHYWLLGNSADPSTALHSVMPARNYNYSYKGSVILNPATGDINSLGLDTSDIISFIFPSNGVANPKRLSMIIGTAEYINGKYQSTGLVLPGIDGSDTIDDIMPTVVRNEIYFASLKNGRMYKMNENYDEDEETNAIIANRGTNSAKTHILTKIGDFPITDSANKHFSKNILGLNNFIWVFPYKIGGENTAPIVKFSI